MKFWNSIADWLGDLYTNKNMIFLRLRLISTTIDSSRVSKSFLRLMGRWYLKYRHTPPCALPKALQSERSGTGEKPSTNSCSSEILLDKYESYIPNKCKIYVYYQHFQLVIFWYHLWQANYRCSKWQMTECGPWALDWGVWNQIWSKELCLLLRKSCTKH